MRNLIAIVLVAGMGLFLSCKNSSKGGKSQVPDDLSIELHQVGCRGTCPDYRMSTDAAGNAKYYGHHAAEMMGHYHKTIDKKTVSAMVDALNTYKFWDFEDEYGGGVADLPYVVTTVTMNGKTKTVSDIRNAPQPLKELEAKIEELFGKEGWTKTEETK